MITNDDMDLTFQALAHETRRAILDRLVTEPGLSVGKLALGFDVSRIAIMNHLKVLEAAGLVISEKAGRTRNLYFNLVPIQLIHERWSNSYSEHFASKLTTIKYAAERAASKKDTS